MIHMIGNAHLDPVWLWRWQEVLAEVKATFRSALDRMEEFPDYHFTSACAAYYEWIEQNAPELLNKSSGGWRRAVGILWADGISSRIATFRAVKALSDTGFTARGIFRISSG